MKKSLIVFCGVLFAASSFAQYAGAMRQAKKVSGQVTTRENQAINANTAPAPQPQPQPAPQPAAQNPALAATQQNISDMAGDIEALQHDPSKKQQFINHLNVAPQGTAPSKATVSKIADDLSAALSGKNISQEQRMKIAQYLRAFSNSSHLTPAQQQALLGDLQKVLPAAGVSSENASKVVTDFKALAAETSK
jgi:truncated hemoglobin YjbI